MADDVTIARDRRYQRRFERTRFLTSESYRVCFILIPFSIGMLLVAMASSHAPHPLLGVSGLYLVEASVIASLVHIRRRRSREFEAALLEFQTNLRVIEYSIGRSDYRQAEYHRDFDRLNKLWMRVEHNRGPRNKASRISTHYLVYADSLYERLKRVYLDSPHDLNPRVL